LRSHTSGRLALIVSVCLLGLMRSMRGEARMSRKASPDNASVAAGSLPGQVQWGQYATTKSFDALCSATGAQADPDAIGCDHGGNGDNILRLVNPNGSANPFLGGTPQTVCAMIYVFDNDEEMEACCGCPISSAGYATFSVENMLLDHFVGTPAGDGLVAVVAALPNPALISLGPPDTNGQGCTSKTSRACNLGCDSTNVPGYSTSTAANLFGSISHNQIVTTNSGATAAVTEIPLFDDAGGDPNNLEYLQAQCGALLGNNHAGGFCTCPTEAP